MTTKEFYTNFDDSSNTLRTLALDLTKDMDKARNLYQETAYQAFKMRNTLGADGNFKDRIVGMMKTIFGPTDFWS